MTFTAPVGATIAEFRIHRFLQHFNPVDFTPGRQYLYSLGQLGDTALEATGSHEAGPGLGSRWHGGGAAAQTEETVTTRSFAALATYAGNARVLRYTIGCHTSPCGLSHNQANPPQ